MSIKIGQLVGVSQDGKVKPSELMLDNSHVGIELEVEGIDHTEKLAYWQIEQDGSLRDNGKEFISRPIAGADIIAAITELCNLINKNKSASINIRTSLHVHLDVSDVPVDKLANVIAASLVFEPFLMAQCEGHRQNNSFCLTSRQAYTNIAGIGRALSSPTEHMHYALRDLSPRQYKYSAINYANITRLGTIEYRMHQGTLDKYEMLKWVNTILATKKLAMMYDSPMAFIDTKRTDGVVYMFRSVTKNLYKNFPDVKLSQLLEDGVEIANDALFLGGQYEPKAKDTPVHEGQQERESPPQFTAQYQSSPTRGESISATIEYMRTELGIQRHRAPSVEPDLF